MYEAYWRHGDVPRRNRAGTIWAGPQPSFGVAQGMAIRAPKTSDSAPREEAGPNLSFRFTRHGMQSRRAIGARERS